MSGEGKKQTYHTNILSIPTLHSPTHLKAHPLIYLHIRHVFRTLEITLNPLLIRNLSHRLKKHPPHALPLCLRTNSNDIAEIVTTRIIPYLRMRFLLLIFPDPVPVYPQPSTAKVEYICEELSG